MPGNIKVLVKQRLTQTRRGQTESCGDFIKKVLAKVKELINNDLASQRAGAQQGSAPNPDVTLEATNGDELIDKIDSRAIRLVDNIIGDGTVNGSIAGGNAQILILAQPGSTQRQNAMNINFYIHTVIHEMMHLSTDRFANGHYSATSGDGWLAAAVVALGYSSDKVTNPWDSPGHPGQETDNHSTTWDDALSQYCGPQWESK